MSISKPVFKAVRSWGVVALLMAHPLVTIACARPLISQDSAASSVQLTSASAETSLAQACERSGTFTNVSYADIPGISSELTSLDISVPPGSKDSLRPVVIYVHGGSWRTGDKAYVGAKRDFFTNAGAIFVSINYRLSPNPPSADPDGIRYPSLTSKSLTHTPIQPSLVEEPAFGFLSKH